MQTQALAVFSPFFIFFFNGKSIEQSGASGGRSNPAAGERAELRFHCGALIVEALHGYYEGKRQNHAQRILQALHVIWRG